LSGYYSHHVGRYIALGFIALLIVIGLAFAFGVIYSPRPFGYYYPMFPIFPFGFFVGLFWIFIIVMVVRWLVWPGWWGRRRYWRYGDESYYILRQRYARGEITKEQYDQMMRDLNEHA